MITYVTQGETGAVDCSEVPIKMPVTSFFALGKS